MSFFSKARGFGVGVARALTRAFGYERVIDTGAARFTDLPDPVLRSRGGGSRRSRGARGLRAANGARVGVRWPANGHRP